jgi:hypothetical protein
MHATLGPTAALDRCAACARETAGVAAPRIEWVLALETNIEEPSVE